MTRLIKTYPIWSFLIINYVISWTFLYPCYRLIQENDGFTPLALIGMIGAYGPTIAAIIVQSVISRKDLKTLLKSIIKYRVGLKLILFVILIPIALYVLAYIIGALRFDGNLNPSWITGLSNIHFWFLAALPFGPMGEELGWRGFMLPKLLKDHSMFKSTILVGLAWGVWHLASFTFPGAAIPSFLSVNAWTISLFCINTIALSFIYTYVHLRSGGSVFLAILLHAFFNAAANIVFDFFGKTDDVQLQTAAYCLNIVLAAVIGYALILRYQRKINKTSSNYTVS